MMKKTCFLLFFLCAGYLLTAQILKPASWAYSSKDLGNKRYELDFTATINKGWHIYSQFIDSGGPIPTSFTFKKSGDYILIGKTKEDGKPIKENDPGFGMVLKYYENEALFSQIIELKKPTADVKGTLEYMVCDASRCLPPSDKNFEFKLPLQSTAIKNDSLQAKLDTLILVAGQAQAKYSAAKNQVSVKSTYHSGEESQSLWLTFLKGLAAGLAILIMPCTYPMIPLTVSYFTKHSKSRRQGVTHAFIYAFFILIIYVLLGVLVTVLFGPNALNDFASDAFFNLLFFAAFVIFSISLFGAFEIILPAGWINASERMSDRGGLIGIFFMAFTLTLVSFSCTFPIVSGFLLLLSKGNYLSPIIGMSACGLMLGLPFGLLALFPRWIHSLPKSGGWLNVVKVMLGFIELGFAFVYLSKVDLAYHWGILPRDLFLTLWIVLAVLLGFYLLGKIKLPHDTNIDHVSVPRLILAIISFSFAVYMLPGLWGAPLNSISGFIPPLETQAFNINNNVSADNSIPANATNDSSVQKKKYSNLFKSGNSINAYFDYDEGMAYARKVNKPVLLDFTGWSCINCRKMEHAVWADKDVLQRLKNDFVIVELYVDDKTILPKEEQYFSKSSGDSIKTIGKKNIDLEVTHFNDNAQPYYVPLDNKGQLLNTPSGYNSDVEGYIQFLDLALKNYKEESQ